MKRTFGYLRIPTHHPTPPPLPGLLPPLPGIAPPLPGLLPHLSAPRPKAPKGDEPKVDEKVVQKYVRAVLRKSPNPASVSRKHLREQVETKLGVNDLSEFKDTIRDAAVQYVIAMNKEAAQKQTSAVDDLFGKAFADLKPEVIGLGHGQKRKAAKA